MSSQISLSEKYGLRLALQLEMSDSFISCLSRAVLCHRLSTYHGVDLAWVFIGMLLACTLYFIFGRASVIGVGMFV